MARYDQKARATIIDYATVIVGKVMYIGINGILPVFLLCVYMRLCVTPGIVMGGIIVGCLLVVFKLLAVFALFYKLYTFRIMCKYGLVSCLL